MGNKASSACTGKRDATIHDKQQEINKENGPFELRSSMSLDSSSTSSQKHKSPRKKNPNKATPPEVESSGISFGENNISRRSFNAVVVTDALTDVRKRYHINPKEIGHGHYGIVRKCMDRETKEWYAIKSILKSKVNKVEILKREIEILAEVDHKNIIKLIEVHEDLKYIHLITELCTGGELFDRIIAKSQTPEGHYSEKDAANLVASILSAIAYCHERQIVHRDLKPENFLFVSQDENAPIKIIDFGLSRHEATGQGIMRTKVGTPYYVAPEVLRKEYTKMCDIWSIGVITYILLCGYPPFYGDSDNQIFDSVKAGRFDFPSPEWDTISDSAKDFVCSLLKLDPSKRLTATQALGHQWIRKQTQHRSSIICHTNERSQPFRSFMGLNKLKKAALAYIATNLTEKEIDCLKGLFERLDTDRDGKLTLSAFEEALASSDEINVHLQEKLSSLREDLALSGNETLVWKDFISAMADKSLLIREEKIRMAFHHFRNNGNKCIRVSDLLDLIGGEEGAKEILDLESLENRSEITYEEFRTMMTESFTEDSEDDS